MTALKELMSYLCATYPAKEDLSNARLTKLIYLCDWESARASGEQLTDIEWHFNHHGPWVPDVHNLAVSDATFEVRTTRNAFGSTKELIGLRAGTTSQASLEPEAKAVADAVVAKTRGMYFGQFIDYVYDTYPVKHSRKYSTLPLAKLAADEKLADEQDEAAVSIDATLNALRAYVEAARGTGLPSDVEDVVELPREFEDPTIEDIVLPNKLSAPQDGTVTIDVDMVIDGFMAKWDAWEAKEVGDVEFHDSDWNDHFAWVYCSRTVTLVFDVEDADKGIAATLLRAL